jgi:hypothetical protein
VVDEVPGGNHRSPAAGGCVLNGEPPTAKGTAEQRVSAVFTVDRTRNPEKSGSLEVSASRSPADAPVSKESDLENPSAIEAGTAKTAERGVFDVFAVGAPKGLGVASGRESVGSTSTPLQASKYLTSHWMGHCENRQNSAARGRPER